MSCPRLAFIDALRQAEQHTAEYKGDGQLFYEALSETWRSVHFDAQRRRGWAQVGSLGRIDFQESGNDAAVIVTTQPLRFKANSENMLEILEQLRKAYDFSG